jgi:hypothetical protein
MVKPEAPYTEPQPDPWGSRAANTAQAAGTGAGAASLGVFLSTPPVPPPVPPIDRGSLAMLPDPAELFGRVAHVLGFQVDALSAWRLGLVLLIVCVALNLLSMWLRYSYAQRVLREHAAQVAAREAQEDALKRQMATPQAKAQGFISGDV